MDTARTCGGSEPSLLEAEVTVIWGGLLVAIAHETRLLICHGRTMEKIKVLNTSSRILHLAELKFSRTNNPLITVEENGHVRKWDITGGWCTKLRHLNRPCRGIICVEDFGLLICYEGDELFLYTRSLCGLECQHLSGPTRCILGAVYMKGLRGLVTYGESGEIFFFERGRLRESYLIAGDDDFDSIDTDRDATATPATPPPRTGRRLKVPAARVNGVIYVHKLGGMMVYGAGGEVFTVKTRNWDHVMHCDPERLKQEILSGPTRCIHGALYVESFGGVVTYGADGEIFLFESLEQDGRCLLGPKQTILGAVYVKELGVLATYGHEGEVYLFESKDKEGHRLKGPKNAVTGAMFVREFGGLVTYGDAGEVYFFNNLHGSANFDLGARPSGDQYVGLCMEGPEDSIREAFFVQEFQGLVTYGVLGELYLFRSPDRASLLELKVTHGVSEQFQIRGAIYVEELKGLVTFKKDYIQLCDFSNCQENLEATPVVEQATIHESSTQKSVQPLALGEGRHLRGPGNKINGIIYVKEFNGLVSYGDHGEVWLFEKKEIEFGCRLHGPKSPIFGALYVHKFGGLVTYGHNGEVFLFKTAELKNQEGQTLKGPTLPVHGASYVSELSGLVVHGGYGEGEVYGYGEGEGEVYLFESSEHEGLRLMGPTKFIHGSIHVKELGGLVTYGGNGEVFLFDSSKHGQQLKGPREAVYGAVYVEELGGLVTYGDKGEVFVFKASAQEGVRLNGPTETICGAVYVKELAGLLTYGKSDDIFFFKRTGQEPLERPRATERIIGATYLREFGGLMVYGGRGEAYLFQRSELARKRSPDDQNLESQVTIKGTKMNLQISSDILRVFEVGKSIFFQGGHYLEIFFNASGDWEKDGHLHSNSMLVEHMENVFSVECINENQLLTVTDTGEPEGMKILFVKDLDSGFLGEGPYNKQGSTSILDLPERHPLLTAKFAYCMEIVFMIVSYCQLAGFAASGHLKLCGVRIMQQLPIPKSWRGLLTPETRAEGLDTKLFKEEQSDANFSVIIIVLLHAAFYLHQWLTRSTLIERRNSEFKGKLADMLDWLLRLVLKYIFVPLMIGAVEGMQCYWIRKEYVKSSVCFLAALALYAWNKRMLYVEFNCKWTSALARTPWSKTWDKKMKGSRDRLVVRRHPLSHASLEFEVQKNRVKTSLCLIAVLFEPLHYPIIVSTLNVVVGGLFLRLSWTREDYYDRTGLRMLTGNCINKVAATSIEAIYVCSWVFAFAYRLELLKGGHDYSFVILVFLLPTISVALFSSALCTCEYLKEKARKQEKSFRQGQAEAEADAGLSPKSPLRPAEDIGLNTLQKKWAVLQARWTILDSDYDELEKQLDHILCKLEAPLLG